jgi:hypothetical protein
MSPFWRPKSSLHILFPTMMDKPQPVLKNLRFGIVTTFLEMEVQPENQQPAS